MTRCYPFGHGFCALAVITRLTHQLQILGPVRPAARQWDFVVHSRINQQKTDPTPARQPLFFYNLVQVFYSVVTFGFKSDSLSSCYVNRTNTGIGVVPRFAGAPRAFGVTAVPMVTRISTAFFTTSRRRITRGIMVFRTWVIGSIEWFPEFLSSFPWAGHYWIKPLAERCVK